MEYADLGQKFVDEISKTVVGRDRAIRVMLIGLLSQGHILIEGNPGIGKTTLAKAFAQTLGAKFDRIQMTPDILPADIIGTNVYEEKDSKFDFRAGPIFGNVILVDELNRATPKAQSALLESMQERQVTYDGRTMKLSEPFIVVATEVPFGSPGTYPLSEVQSDRFAYSIHMDFPTVNEEIDVLGRIDEIETRTCRQIITLEELANISQAAREVFVSDPVKKYIVSLVNFLRTSQNLKNPPSVRASISLHKGARAMAALDNKDHIVPDDIKFLAPFVFWHRIYLTPEALTAGITPDQLISEMLDQVPVPKE